MAQQRPIRGGEVVPVPGNAKVSELQVNTTALIPEDLRFGYCDGIVATSTKHEFVVSFMQVQHPLLTGPLQPDEVKNFVVYNKCIARLIVAVDRMPEFIESLQTALDSHQKRHRPLPEQEKEAIETDEVRAELPPA